MRFFDRQDEARAQTLRLLLLFVLTVIALLLAINAALALTWRAVSPGFTGYPAFFFSVNTAVTLLFVLGGWWLESSALRAGGQKLARQAGAREAWPASREAERRLCNIVDELALAASMKPPLAMVLVREQGINAFAAGWDENDAIVAVTQGALDYLTRDELQGLVAHEFSHLREGDTRLNMRLAGMVFGLEMIFNLGHGMCEADESGRRSFLAVPGLAIMLAGSLGWLAGRALKAAVSRQREYLADARAVQFTRSKEGLGGVLRKVAGQQGPDFLGSEPKFSQPKAGPSGAAHGVAEKLVSDPNKSSLHPLVQHMLLVGASRQSRWFATHPPVAERIRRIYGRPMAALPTQRDSEAVTRPDAIY